MIIFWIIIFVLSIYLLVSSSDRFIEHSEKLGKGLGISSFIIGATIISIGTSLPELVTSVIAVVNGYPEIVIGNVVGSNIANILLVGGVAILVGKKLILKHNVLGVDIPIFILSAFLLSFMLYDSKFTLLEGIISLIGFMIYALYFSRSKSEENVKRKFYYSSFFWVIVNSLLIYVGAKYTIESVVNISNYFNIGKGLLATSIVALGTSLPELSVGIRAAMKGKGDIVVGDVIGSNIFNSFSVMGISSLFGTLVASDGGLLFSLLVMVAVTIAFSFMVMEKEVTIWEGGFLVLFYLFFIAKLFNLI